MGTAAERAPAVDELQVTALVRDLAGRAGKLRAAFVIVVRPTAAFVSPLVGRRRRGHSGCE